jgi:hypothetical protein
LATAPATLFVGRAVFTDKPQLRELAGDFARSLPQLLLLHGLLRFYTCSLPHLNEIILLERNPLIRRGPSGPSTIARARALHRGNRSDLMGRSFASVVYGAMMALGLWLSLVIMRIFLLNRPEWDTVLFTVYWPLSIWASTCFFAVVRFLCYLDLRVRREGWEVELSMRAEAARLARQLP